MMYSELGQVGCSCTTELEIYIGNLTFVNSCA